MAFMTATVFFRTTLNPDNIQDGSLYLSMIFFSLVHIMFNSYAEMSLTVSPDSVFYRGCNRWRTSRCALLFSSLWIPQFISLSSAKSSAFGSSGSRCPKRSELN